MTRGGMANVLGVILNLAILRMAMPHSQGSSALSTRVKPNLPTQFAFQCEARDEFFRIIQTARHVSALVNPGCGRSFFRRGYDNDVE